MRDFDDIKMSMSFPEMALEKALNSFMVIPEGISNKALSPSGLGCPRGSAFKLSGAPTAGDEETYESGLARDMGTFIHERTQKFLSTSSIWVDIKDFLKEHPELGLEIRKEQKHVGELSLYFSGIREGKKISPPFSFQCDGMVKIDNEYYVIEIKTESEEALERRNSPNPKYNKQAVAYSFLYGVKNILWIYASRESFGKHRKVFLQTIKEKEVADFISTCNDIEKAVTENDIKSLAKGKDCQWCTYRDLCKNL